MKKERKPIDDLLFLCMCTPDEMVLIFLFWPHRLKYNLFTQEKQEIDWIDSTQKKNNNVFKTNLKSNEDNVGGTHTHTHQYTNVII